MIEWTCDACGARLEHEDANPPPGWATVRASVTWRNEEKDSNSEWMSGAIVLCDKGCRTGSGDALEARALMILRQGFGPRAVEGKNAEPTK